MQTSWLTGLLLALLSVGCSDEAAPGAASGSASAPPQPTTKPTATVTATASASAAPAPPRSDCPKDSAGAGTLAEPCQAKGTSRMMEARWTGKTDDKGPHFNVVNKAPLPILYGKIVVYFYDKAGKQLEVEDKKSTPPKTLPYRVCSGSNLFSGVMKVDEKAVLTFSCVAAEHVPEGTATIEGELMTVGFADATGTKNDFYWNNTDLTPDVRPKGGVKAK